MLRAMRELAASRNRARLVKEAHYGAYSLDVRLTEHDEMVALFESRKPAYLSRKPLQGKPDK